jgi:drug/metabolite transporter (DMT)-like permease
VLSVLCAVLAAAANAAASVLQRKAARRGGPSDVGAVRMLLGLLRQGVWVGGIGCMLGGFLLQAAALATGPIALVQPVLVIELSFTLVLSGLVFRTRLHGREWTAVLGMSAGLALLLLGLAPSGGDPVRATGPTWLIGCVITLGVVGLLVGAGHRARNSRRAEFLGAATGVMFGFTAVLVAGITAVYGRTGFVGVFTAWQTYALVVFGPAGFFLLQYALRAGRLVASQPGMTLANPLVAIGWGVTAFGEQAQTGGWVIADVLGALLIGGCTVLLARSPLLHDDDDDDDDAAEEPVPAETRS